MRHFFLDTNVLLDFLVDRKPFSEQAALLFQGGLNAKVTLYVAAISFNNLYYIIRQGHSHQKTLMLIKALSKMVETVPIGGPIIANALESDFKDFEDAIQYYAAASMNDMEAIVTRNPKDFKSSKLPVLAPEAAVSLVL